MTQQNEIPEGCIEFNLEKALAGWPVVTREGQEAKIFMLSEFEEKYQVKGLIKKYDCWISEEWTKLGKYIVNDSCDDFDLFLKKKNKTYYQNIYRHNSAGHLVTGILSTDVDLDESSRFEDLTLIKTISFDIDDIEEKPRKIEMDYELFFKLLVFTKTVWKDTSKFSIESYHLYEKLMACGFVGEEIELDDNEIEQKPKTESRGAV